MFPSVWASSRGTRRVCGDCIPVSLCVPPCSLMGSSIRLFPALSCKDGASELFCPAGAGGWLGSPPRCCVARL